MSNSLRIMYRVATEKLKSLKKRNKIIKYLKKHVFVKVIFFNIIQLILRDERNIL